MQFLYADGTDAHFMDTSSYEQMAIPETAVADALRWTRPNDEVDVLFIDGEPSDLQLPASVELEVTQTEPGLRGDTASGGGTKPATLETGASINVPLFVNVGDRVKVQTSSGDYMSRARQPIGDPPGRSDRAESMYAHASRAASAVVTSACGRPDRPRRCRRVRAGRPGAARRCRIGCRRPRRRRASRRPVARDRRRRARLRRRRRRDAAAIARYAAEGAELRRRAASTRSSTTPGVEGAVRADRGVPASRSGTASSRSTPAAVFLGLKEVLPHMGEGGAVVNTASIARRPAARPAIVGLHRGEARACVGITRTARAVRPARAGSASTRSARGRSRAG